MSFTLEEIRAQFQILNFKEPSTVAFLPINFGSAVTNDKALYSPLTDKLERYLAKSGQQLESVDSDADRLYLDNRADDLVLPLLICCLPVLSENRALATVLLNLVSAYLHDLMKMTVIPRKVKMRSIMKNGDHFESLEYEGPVDGLAELTKWAHVPSAKKRTQMTTNEFLVEFDKALPGILRATFATRNVAMLEAAEKLAAEWAEKAQNLKEAARAANQEAAANLLLCVQCAARGLECELKFWLHFKAGEYASAWEDLIDAEDYLTIAVKAEDNDLLRQRLQRLVQAEGMLFPRPLFASCGLAYRTGRCTICSGRFDHCDHIEGVVYSGKLCREVDRRDLKLNEVSLVEEPRDKRCRVMSYEDDDGQLHDCFTEELVESNGERQNLGGRFLRFLAYRFETIKDV